MTEVTLKDAILSIGEYIDNLPPSRDIDDTTALAMLAGQILEWSAKETVDIRAEAFAYARLNSPEAVGQMIMECFSSPMMVWGMPEKIFFTQVAEVVGPDYVSIIRGVSAFMDRVDEFQINMKGN